jgi:uncharacterized membrane protein
MLGRKIFGSQTREDFRHRGKEIVRVEALSDAVFAFSVSLLVASLEVPQTFDELKTIIQGGLPFFATVAIIFLLWYQQYMFFRRYGLNDFITILLNLAYLAIILFYVYPLKFLFSILISSWTGINLFPKATEKGLIILNATDFSELIILFSAGYFLIWMLIYLMHQRAMHFSIDLKLSKTERLFTCKEKRGALWNALIGATAIIFAWAGEELFAGICYLVIPVLLIVNQQIFKKQISGVRRRIISHVHP